jgi:hypothetical protein
MSKPQVLHLDVVKQMFRYLKCTIDHGIFFQKNGSKKIKGFIDVDWVGDDDQRLYFGLHIVPPHGVINVN